MLKPAKIPVYRAFATTASVFLVLLIAGTIRGEDPAPSASTASAINDKMPGLTLQKDFPAIKLRGYGTLSGKYWTDATGGSLVEIDCADAEHARLVQAKYLSDLAELPPATTAEEVTVRGTKITVNKAEDVGSVAALRNGTTVILVTAKNSAALAQLIANGMSGDLASWTSQADGKVPMWLDRFDKYGFRFYYAPGRLKPGPDGKHEDPSYDPRQDFDFAKSVNGGLLVWHDGGASETGEGMSKEPVWDWALAMAKKNGMAFGVNLGISGASNWYYNRHPESMMQNVPGFLGTYYGSMNFGIPPMISWCSPEGQDAMLGQLQSTVRRFNDTENITSWLEPHEELGGGVADLYDEWGPQADASFQAFMRGKYKTLPAISQRWYGDPTTMTNWNQVHVPELAEFLGFDGDAIDLAGTWRVDYGAADNPAALVAEFDDSKWGQMQGPGHGLARMLPPQPALWRRHVKMDSGWLGKHPQVWLYVWDMNDTRQAKKGNDAQGVIIALNGQTLKETHPLYPGDHWAALDVSSVIKPDDNVLAIRLPRGIFNYRVYISGEEPKSYPALGEGKNAEWVDLNQWRTDIRVAGVRRGMQMIRQVDPNRGIVLMAPDQYWDGLIQNAIDYGGDFHNTGYMGGWWCDRLPALMRGAGLPFSVEPSQGPTLPEHILNEFGNWISQGCNAVDHFQNLGEILWHPDLKKCFEDHAALYTSMGRYHCAPAQVAVIYSSRINTLYGFPWNVRPALDNGKPYFEGGAYVSGFNSRSFFSPVEHEAGDIQYESDAVTESMFERHQVNKYRVIVDTNTSVMSEETIDGLARYVKAGGIFVTYGQTGRHSPEKPDSWPIERLTGFHIGGQPGNGMLALDPNQKLMATDYAPPSNLSGQRLEPLGPDSHALLTWIDGSTAVGFRQLGKGYVITMGLGFNHLLGHDFFTHLFQGLKIDPIPAHYEGTGIEVFWRHFVSNNGLYDIWTLRNNSRTTRTTGTLILDNGLRPAWAIDLNGGNRIAVTDGKIPIDLPPSETVLYITPRSSVSGAAADWFDLQRGWWQGTTDPGVPLAKLEMKLIVDLSQDWAFQPVDPQQGDISAMFDVAANDSAWKKIRLGIFSLPDYPDVKHAVLRKHFHVPDNWNHGSVALRLPPGRGKTTWYLDGQLLKDAALTAGTDHVLAVDIQGQQTLLGLPGDAWLTYHPTPAGKQDLAGMWDMSKDLLNWTGRLMLPGPMTEGVRVLRSYPIINAAARGKTVVLHGDEDITALQGVVINGHYLRPWREAPEMNINITPWIVPGQSNEMILICSGGKGGNVSGISLEFHTPGTYP
jgi:hypothetical protein